MTRIRRSAAGIVYLLLSLSAGFPALVQGENAQKPGDVTTAVLIDPASPRVALLKQIHLLVTPITAVPAALDVSRYRVAIIDGTPANLLALQQHAKELDQFTRAGGWVMLWGVTPEGIATFDRIVGVNHVIRPFGMEKVAAADVPVPLSAGIVSNDLVMYSNQLTSPPGLVPLMSDDAWSYVVDLQDIAPFCQFPPPAYWGYQTAEEGTDHLPRDMVKGIDDYWQFSFTIPMTSPRETDWTMKLPREETIDGFSIEREPLFSRITKVRLSFPGTDAKPIDLDITQDGRQDFSFPPVKADAVEISLTTDGKHKGLTGIRNLRLHVARSADYTARVRPLASIGVLVAYLRGDGEKGGGIVLNEMNVPEHDSLPENAAKKQTILNAVLRNLHAPFDPAAPVPMRKAQWLQKGTAWDDPANWSVGQVPGKTDIACFPAVFDSVAAVSPAISHPTEVGGLEFDNDFGGPPIAAGHELAPGVKPMQQHSPSWIISGAGPLSIGAGGISVIGHQGSDLISCDLRLDADQTWHIGDQQWEPNVLIHDQYGNITNLVLAGTLSGPGAWVKEGAGRVYYANNTSPTFAGGLTVRGAAVEWALTQLASGGSYQFGSGPITLDDGSFCFGANDTPTKNTVEITNPVFVTPKNGLLEISAETMRRVAPPLVRYTGEVHLAGNLKLAHSTKGGGVSGLDLAGPVLLDQSASRTLGLAMGDFVTGWSVFPIVRGDLHDQPGPAGTTPAGNPLVLRSLINSFLIAGTHNDYAEDTWIDTCGNQLFSGSADAVVVAGPGAVLGKANIVLQPGGHLNLTNSSNIALGKSITLDSDAASLGVLGLAYNGLPDITPDSTGVLAIETKNFDALSDLSKIGNGRMRLGTFGGGRFTGKSLAPGANNLYRLGGGGSGRFFNTTPLTLSGALLNGSAGVEVGSTAWWGNGNVALDGANDFTGSLIVQSPAPPSEEFEDMFETSLSGVAQRAAGASPFGSPSGSVLLDNAYLQLSAQPGDQPVTKGPLTVAGHGHIVVTGVGSLTFADFRRQDQSVLTIEALHPKKPGDGPQLHFSSWQKPLPVVEPYINCGSDFASYDPTSGIQPFANYVTDLAKAGPDDVLRIGPTALTGQTVRAKDLKTTGAITGTGAFVLSGGGLIATGDFHPDLDFADSEGVIFGPCNLLGKIAGKHGLTIAEAVTGGRTTVGLLNPNNDFTGPVTVDNAVILVRFDTQDANGKDVPGSLGDLHNDIFLNGGFIKRVDPGPQTELADTRTITLGPSGGGFFFYASGSSQSHIRARITGPGMLTQFVEDGRGLIIDNPANDYSGGTKVVAGENVGMTAGPRGKLGTGPVLIDPESQLILQGDHNIDPRARLEVALGGIARFTSTSPHLGSLTGAGVLYLNNKAGTSLTVGGDDSDFTFLGSIIEENATASVTKTGGGTWTLYGAQHYTGPTTVVRGMLDLRGSVAGDVIVSFSGRLRGGGTVEGDLKFQPHSEIDVLDGGTGLQVVGKAMLDPTVGIRADSASSPARLTILTAKAGIAGPLPPAPAGFKLVLSADKTSLDLEKN